MNLTERYLAAVRLLLPRAKRDDIVTELQDVLTGRREERSAELGRDLTLAEEEALLRDFGHPVVIAGRYRKQQYLVGPDIYPVYAFALKLVLLVVAVVALVVGVVNWIAASGALGDAVVEALAVAWNG